MESVVDNDKKKILAGKSLDQLDKELASLPEVCDEAQLYHDEILRRQSQGSLDTDTAKLVSETTSHSYWKILVLGLALLAVLASIFLPN